VGFLLRRPGLAHRLGGDGRPRAAAPAAALLHRPRAQAGGGSRMRAALYRRWMLRAVLIAGLAFFYAPIVSVGLFSFNSSTSAAVGSGFSLRWYQELLGNDNILRAAKLSVAIAAMSATGATILGTLAGYALSRFGWFKGRTLLSAMATSPLVMPEII